MKRTIKLLEEYIYEYHKDIIGETDKKFLSLLIRSKKELEHIKETLERESKELLK